MVATNQDVSHLRDAVLEWKRFARIRIVLLEIAVNSESTGHKAVFPRALPEFFIKAFSDPGDVILDPFCGSGTTLAAAFGLGRSGFGCELSPAYTDVIVRRIQNLSSRNFHLDNDGRSFEDIKLDRICGNGKQSEVVAA